MERTSRLRRRRRDRGGVLLGLCAGMGAHLGVDAVLIRFGLLLLLFLSPGGSAVGLLYLLFSLFVPYEEE